MFPLNHKTVFVMDHSPAFSQPCDVIDFDGIKSQPAQQQLSQAMVPLASVAKSVWTSAAESVLEYCRIVWDIFPPTGEEQRLIRFVVSGANHVARPINAWSVGEQTAASVASGLALAGRPEPVSRSKSALAKGYDIRIGIGKALEMLCEPTEAQNRARLRSSDADPASSQRLANKGRIVCMTYRDQPEQVEAIVSSFKEQFARINNPPAGSDALSSTVASIELDIVLCHGMNQDLGNIEQVQQHELTPSITYSVCTVAGGTDLSKKLLSMALRHYDLASTTVTGIPMKEEQNASSSANYDVELFHKASAHARLLASDVHFGSSPGSSGSGDVVSQWMPQTQKEGCEYKTITLKWCTPRGSSADLHNCTALARVTPTDVNSRPSSCLTNFLLSGRSVMLEMPRRTGSKILSHMLTSHGGEIFVHTLNISRSVLEDPPSISEGSGGRVTDYRITDFGELMKANRMAPYYGDPSKDKETPLDKMRARVARFTKFCPMTISATTICNMEAVVPLQRLLVQEELSEDNLAECRKVIYSLLSMEHKGEQLPVPLTAPGSSGGKSKAMKKDEQYKLMFGELERFIAIHCRTERHHKVLDCLLESRNRPVPDRNGRNDDSNKVELDVALRELDKYSAMTEREKNEFNMTSDGILRSNTNTPLSPPPVAKRPKLGHNTSTSLLDMWNKTQASQENKKALPFFGMKSLGEKAKLYLSLERKDNNKDMNTPTEM